MLLPGQSSVRCHTCVRYWSFFKLMNVITAGKFFSWTPSILLQTIVCRNTDQELASFDQGAFYCKLWRLENKVNASVAAVLVRSSDFDNATIFIVDQISGHFPDSFAVLIRSSTMSSTGMYSSTLQVCTQVLYRYVLKYSTGMYSSTLVLHSRQSFCHIGYWSWLSRTHPWWMN